MHKKILLVLFFALFVSIFAIQNANPVLIKIIQWELEISLVLIVLGAVVFGSMLMAVVTSFNQIKLSKKIKLLNKEKEELIYESKELRKKYKNILEKIDLEKKDLNNIDNSHKDDNNNEIRIHSNNNNSGDKNTPRNNDEVTDKNNDEFVD